MDKSILAEYIDAVILIEDTEKRLEKLTWISKEVLQDSVKGSNPNFPYEQKTFHIEGIGSGVTTDEIARLKNALRERRDLAKKLRIEVEEWMNQAPFRIQRIVQMKYFEGKTWDVVSAQLGCMSPDAARMELNRYLKTPD